MRVWVQSSVISNVHARVIVICSVLTRRLCSWLVSILQFFFTIVLCLVERALSESGDCSDVWNVRYSSAHFSTGSRRGTRISIRLIFRSELRSCFESCFDLRETVLPLGTVARTPQSHEHVSVASCIGPSLCLSTTFTLSLFWVIFCSGKSLYLSV